MQLFVKGIDGSCRALHLEGPEPKASELWDCLKCEFPGIDESHCFVTCAGKVLRHADESLLAQGAGPDSTLQLSARLVGGKGGFGSLLRGLGRDGKVVDNFDACRDLTGRRLRHKEAEQKLAAWASDARERQLEKVATSFIKDMARKSQADAKAEFDVSAFREQQSTAASGVKSALRSGLTEAAAQEKSRKRIAEEREEKLKKKAKLLGLEDLSDEEDDDDDDSEAEGEA